MDKEMEDRISQLQLLEQNLQNFVAQKQNFQAHLFEVENALKELDSSKGTAYKIVGAIMIASDNAKLKKDLEEKKDVLGMRIKSIQKQEDSMREKAERIQAEVMKGLKEDK